MPTHCVKCKKQYDKSTAVSFHCFPKDEIMRERWLNALGLDKINFSIKPRVCSSHFREDDFVLGGNLRKLRKDAIPSIRTRGILDDLIGDAFSFPSPFSLTCETPQMPCASSTSDIDAIKEEYCETTPSPVFNIEPSKLTVNIEQKKKSANNSSIKMTRILPEKNTTENELNTSPAIKRKRSSLCLETTSDSIKSLTSNNCSCTDTLKKEITYHKEINNILEKSLKPKPMFDLERFANEDRKILYYTGFQTYQLLTIVFKWILPSGDVKEIAIHKKNEAHLHTLTAKNQFLLTLMRLRRGTETETLGDMFFISQESANNIFLCWVNLLYLRLGCLDIWPNRNVLVNRASDSMRSEYPNIIGSLDCTEVFKQRPSSLKKQNQCYSSYKSLVVIEPAGAFIYVSPLFTGSISDGAIIAATGFIDILKEKVENGQILPKDVMLVDKGFDLFKTADINLNIPVFRINGVQCTSEEVETAQERIHVERAICRLKKYKILAYKIPFATLGTMEQIYTVCALLCNFRYGLIQYKRG